MIKKYGKKYGEIGKIKQSFLTENERLLRERDYIGDVYRKQPLRENCKLCNHPLNTGKEKSFTNHKITYKICSICGHVNGIYDDTEQFSKSVYCEADYGETYSEKTCREYRKRKELIYSPKVQFLEEVLPEKLSILEIGSGSGYFCSAANDSNYNIQGIEISEKQVDFANKMLGKSLSQHVSANKVADIVRNTEREIVVAIGSIEHLYNMSEILRAIKENKLIKYFYFSVPLFSLSSFFEMMFQDGFNRQDRKSVV